MRSFEFANSATLTGAIGGTAAIASAVFNAIGVRVPTVPVTADRVLNAIGNRRYA